MAPDPHVPGTTDTATSDLLERARAGDAEALEVLFARHIPGLKRWASGRLPRWARDITDTTDLVQETLVETLKHLDTFECRGEGALRAYLRQAVLNRIRNQLRQRARRGPATTLDSAIEDDRTSPLEAAIGEQTRERYEAGLQRLTQGEREAIVSRVELGMSYDDLAEVLGKPSANAARMTVVRALVRLAEEMKGTA